MKPKPKSRASALLLATILLFAILTVIISLSSVTVMEMKMGQKGKTSVASFYDAESGVEWALNTVATGNGDIKSKFTPNSDGSITCPAGVGGAGCKVYFLKADGTAMTQAEINASSGAPTFADVRSVRSVGREGNDTQRAIEAAVADTGGGGYSYVAFGTTSCDSQYRVAYTGEAMSIQLIAGTSPSNIICSHTTVPSSAEQGGWQNGIYGNRFVVSCAVCVK